MLCDWRPASTCLVSMACCWHGNTYLPTYLIMFAGSVPGFDLFGDDECGFGISGYLVDGTSICSLSSTLVPLSLCGL